MNRSAEKKWRPRIAAWKRSGKTLAAYARETGLSEVTLGSWKRRFETPAAVEFVELAPKDAPGFVIDLQGCRIEVAARFEEDEFRKLLRVLEDRR